MFRELGVLTQTHAAQMGGFRIDLMPRVTTGHNRNLMGQRPFQSNSMESVEVGVNRAGV